MCMFAVPNFQSVAAEEFNQSVEKCLENFGYRMALVRPENISSGVHSHTF
jgi:hypothetical protein